MMDELALKLKEAGFPGMVGAYKDPNSNTLGGNADGSPIEGWEHFWYFPTLSDLIEACDFKNHTRFQLIYRGNVKTWQAALYDTKRHHWYMHGTTPEEAVANLWIALNPQ